MKTKMIWRMNKFVCKTWLPWKLWNKPVIMIMMATSLTVLMTTSLKMKNLLSKSQDCTDFGAKGNRTNWGLIYTKTMKWDK